MSLDTDDLAEENVRDLAAVRRGKTPARHTVFTEEACFILEALDQCGAETSGAGVACEPMDMIHIQAGPLLEWIRRVHLVAHEKTVAGAFQPLQIYEDVPASYEYGDLIVWMKRFKRGEVT